MANVKITGLTAYTDPVSTDVLPIVDVSNDATKKVSIADLLENAGTGSAAAPSFSFDGDSNTGIYRPGEDQIAISTNGTQRLSINSAGLASFANNVTIEGDLTVNGATTTIDSTTLIVEDKNIEMGSVTTPTDSTADGGGITLKGATDKTINWINSTDAWTLSEHVNIASAKEFRIAGTKVLDATSLGSAVVSSSLTSVGTIGTGVWNGTAIASAYIADSAITSAKIADGAIVNADVNASAAIAGSKITTGTTSAVGVLQLTDSTSSTSTTTAATPNSVKTAYDLANAALPKAGGTLTGDLTIPDKIIHSGDTNTAIRFPAADTFAVETAGTERLRIDSSGRLLVGTSSARDKYASDKAPRFQVEGTTKEDSSISITRWNVGLTAAPVLFFGGTNSDTPNVYTLMNDEGKLGEISFEGADGSKFVPAAKITAIVDGTPGANDMPGRLVFATTADGASSPTERMRIDSAGALTCPGVYSGTTALAANVRVGAAGGLQRSTSSIKYKTSVETLENSYADALLSCRPVWYKSKCASDDPTWGHWGFIAEEVAEIDPRLVHWKTSDVSYDENGSIVETASEPEPEGVQYDRFVPHLLNLIKRQQAAIESLEAKVTALESA